ncbi:Panacea domain-containing protein [Clostridium sp.]|jgi:uncharacterized phage-associated protein|uniref:Panacea domain-containing protein n=1 Tax=Clostridium sp. TaxID=1506 RepID=UPI0035A024A5
MCRAIDIAKYIINRCIDIGRPISNLQLQKILYYVQGEFMKKNDGETLFQDNIEAWQYGPVVRDVYYAFNNYSSSNIITRQDRIELDECVKDIINPVIDSKSKLSAWDLVKETHLQFPWQDTYDGTKNKIITEEKMRKFFCN